MSRITHPAANPSIPRQHSQAPKTRLRGSELMSLAAAIALTTGTLLQPNLAKAQEVGTPPTPEQTAGNTPVADPSKPEAKPNPDGWITVQRVESRNIEKKPDGNIEKITTLSTDGQVAISYKITHDDPWTNNTGALVVTVVDPQGEATNNVLTAYLNKSQGTQLMGGQIDGQPILGRGKLLTVGPTDNTHQEGKIVLLSANQLLVSSLDGQTSTTYQLGGNLFKEGDTLEVSFMTNKNAGANLDMVEVQTRPPLQATANP